MPIAKTPQFKEYLRRLRERLDDNKVSHSIFTAEYLSSFAGALDIDHDEAVTAGLLHDFCRDLKKDAFLEQARALHLPLSESQLRKPALLHGPVAAERCRKEFGISDAVYEAIYWHTTGRPGLGRLGQALFVADFSEPTRKFPEAAQARKIMRTQGFDAALIHVAEQKILLNRDKPVRDPNSEVFYLWLKGRQ